MSEPEKRRNLEAQRNGKQREATTARKITLASAGYSFAETTLSALSGQGILPTVLATFGILAPPATTIASISIAAIATSYGIFRLAKSKKFSNAEAEDTNEAFMSVIEPLVADVKKLCDTLEQDKSIWVEKAMTMKTKEYKIAYAQYVDSLIEKLNLKHLDRTIIQKMFEPQKKEKPDKKDVKNKNLIDKETERGSYE